MFTEVQKTVEKALKDLGVSNPEVVIEFPENIEYGHVAVNSALKYAKELGVNPKELAEKLQAKVVEAGLRPVERVEVAGLGFINFFFTKEFFAGIVKDAATNKQFGKNTDLKDKKAMYEYTDPNPFKELHIGHLMSNTVGEALSRITGAQGAEVIRANYQGDVGPHVAKAIWGKKHNPDLSWGEAYAFGSARYDENKEEIDAINKAVYARDNEEINTLYDEGRKTSLDAFEKVYKKLGTKFDHYFFESEVWEPGLAVVKQGLQDGVFKESDGAVVYEGEPEGLHTRVFVNSQGLPTYETKDMGLAKAKFEKVPDIDMSVTVTAHEQEQYFKVILAAMAKCLPDIAAKTEHVAHGMMKLPGSKKMSSRTGDVIGGEAFIDEVKTAVLEKMAERTIDESKRDGIAESVAIAAIKYIVLRSGLGSDVIYDKDKAVSFEGDSGPYVLYTAVRAGSVLKKAGEIDESVTAPENWETTRVEHLLFQYESVVRSAYTDMAPQKLVTYVTELASSFNSMYAHVHIVENPYAVLLTKAVKETLESALDMLGMRVPEEM